MSNSQQNSHTEAEETLKDRFPSQAEGDRETIDQDLKDQEKKSQDQGKK